MKIGIGTYRINPSNQNHLDAIEYALSSGINTVEVSSNYSDGRIEKQISSLINDDTRIIIKAGYVQSDKVYQLEDLEKRCDKKIFKIQVNETNVFCLDPLYIDQEIDLAIENLGRSVIDTFHIHNPENLFIDSKIDPYEVVKNAFLYLEKAVSDGRIKNYGISSNTFILPKTDKGVINLEKLIDTQNYPHFKSIQFPLNLVELGALERQFSGMNLIDFAKANGIEVIINRPLNGFTDKGLLRLAEYTDYKNYQDDISHDEIFETKIKSLKDRFDANKDDPLDQLEDIALLNQIKSFWSKQISKDAVDQVFFEHFFPLVANIWGENLTSDESQDFYDLYDIACNFAKKNMNTRALSFKKQAIESSLLDDFEQKLQLMAIKKYKSYGVDLCLIGLRSKKYVEDFSQLI